MQKTSFYVGQEVECPCYGVGKVYGIDESSNNLGVDFGIGVGCKFYDKEGRLFSSMKPTLKPVTSIEKEVSLISTTITNALLEAYKALKNYDEKTSVAIRNTKHRPSIAMLNKAIEEGRTVAEMIEQIKPDGCYSIIEENCKGCDGPCGNCYK